MFPLSEIFRQQYMAFLGYMQSPHYHEHLQEEIDKENVSTVISRQLKKYSPVFYLQRVDLDEKRLEAKPKQEL